VSMMLLLSIDKKLLLKDYKMKEKLEPLSKVLTLDRVVSGVTQIRVIDYLEKTPVYVYSEELLREQADKALSFPNAFGLTVRYAMKANSNKTILRIMYDAGINIDASSSHEVQRAIDAGIPRSDILVTSQEITNKLNYDLIRQGISYDACSLEQLEFLACMKYFDFGIRINPGLGSGGTNRTNTGGPASPFGIWHEQIGKALKILKNNNKSVHRIHTHIGSGSDPEVWKEVALKSLGCVERFLRAGHPIDTLNLGGGFKIGRMSYEPSTNLQDCGNAVKEAFKNFYKKTGVKLKLEIEPGTFLVANAGCLITKVIDMKRTPKYNFIIVNSMAGTPKETERYLVFGHCCESGDLWTPAPGDSEGLKPRVLQKASVGDYLVISGTGAYCSSMSTANYNSYPRAPEVLITREGKFITIRKRETLEQMTQNEV
jgi:diaminopimelate decarboxylase